MVYLTEDEGPDGFYRFVPEQIGNLRKGVLQMLRVKGQPKYNTITGQTVGDVARLRLGHHRRPRPEDADDDASAVFKQGRAKGAAKFLGGEGCTMRDDSVVFGSSDGGDVGRGQVWQYTPRKNIGTLDERGDLELLFESADKSQLDGPDNMCTSPDGAIVIAEDGEHRQQLRPGAAPERQT